MVGRIRVFMTLQAGQGSEIERSLGDVFARIRYIDKERLGYQWTESMNVVKKM